MGFLKKKQAESEGVGDVVDEAPDLPPDDGMSQHVASAAGARQFPRATVGELPSGVRRDSDEAQMVADFIARNINLLPEKIAENTLLAPQALLAVLGDEKRMAELDERVNGLLGGITQAYVEQTKAIIATTLGRQDAPQQQAGAELAGAALQATAADQVDQAQKQRDAELVAQFLASNYNLVPDKVAENTRQAAPALQAVLADQERMAAISDQVDQLVGGINQVYIKETKAVIATTLQRADAQEMVACAVAARAELPAGARRDSDEAQMVADFIARNMNLLPEKIAENTLLAPQALLAVLGDEKRMAELDERVNGLLDGITQAYVEQTKAIIATTLGRQDAPQQQAGAERQATTTDQVDQAQRQSDADSERSQKDRLPPELQLLYELLKARDWSVDQSPDPAARAHGAVAWTLIEGEVMKAVDAGYGVEVNKLWEQFAPPGHDGLEKVLQRARASEQAQPASPDLPVIVERILTQAPAPYLRTYDPRWDNVIDIDVDEIPDQPFADEYTRPNWAQRPVPGHGMASLDPLLADQQAQQQLQPAAGGAGIGNVDMLSKMLSAPFALTAAAGSMMMNSLKAIGGKAKSYYAKERINGHAILGAQLDQHANEVSSLTKSLRQQGMDGLIDAMRATGRPAREVCAGMAPGGPYEHLGKRFSELMQDADFSKKYARLHEVLDEFNYNASRYAASGVELDLDYSDAIDRNLESISAATEGFVQEKDGVIKHLQEMAKQISERICELVDSLMGRFKP